MFTFTPLLGAQSASSASQSLLEADGGVKILVDVGWDEAFDAAQLRALEDNVSSLSFILLTHPTTDHIGAYAHCCKNIPQFNQIPVYATTPVINLGRTLLLDLYASTPRAASTLRFPGSNDNPDPSSSAPQILLQPPSTDEIASYFGRIHPLKYSQPHQPLPSPFSQPLGNLTITAYSAGHTLGGTIWHIQYGLESIVYAADWNQGRENLLSGAAWLAAGGGAEIIEPLRRPTALVCSSKGVEETNSLPRKKRDELLTSAIRETIAQGGKILIPTDSSARVLELALVLNQTWQDNIEGPHADTFKHVRVYMASRTCASTLRQMQSMLEWMDDAIIRDVEAAMSKDKGDEKSSNSLDWRHIKPVERKGHLEKILRRPGPCVILASDSSLEWGFSRQALEALAGDSRNAVLLTDSISQSRFEAPNITGQIFKIWRNRSQEDGGGSELRLTSANGSSVNLRDVQMSSLNDDENLLYQQYLTRQRQMHSSVLGDNSINDATTTEIADDQASDSSDSEDEDDNPERQGRALNLSAQMTQTNKRKTGLSDAELGINVLLRGKNVHDYDVRNKRGRERVFPFVLHKAKSDDYGDAIKPEDYLRAEERDDVDGVDMRDGNKPEPAAVGQKRKWDEANIHGNFRSKGRRDQKEPPAKQPKVEREPDDIDALIARATGENGGEQANGDDLDDADDDSEYEPEENEADGPQKIETTTRELVLQLKIVHINFSGIHDKRDLQMLIPLIQPRKLILIAGDVSETLTLAQECRQLLNGDEAAADIFTPLIGETVNASVDTNAWTLKLSRLMSRKLVWQNVKGLGVVALTGRLIIEDDSTSPDAKDQVNKKAKLSGSTDPSVTLAGSIDQTPIPVLDLISTTSNLSTANGIQQRPTQPVHVGDLRLVDLRRLMHSSGHTAEFRGEGTLLIDGSVVVRKSTTGKIEIEAGAGGFSLPRYRTKENEGSFYAVRKLIYGGLAVVAGV